MAVEAALVRVRFVVGETCYRNMKLVLWEFGLDFILMDFETLSETLRNMNGCVSFNYSFTEFWRIWHSSMNEFMIRSGWPPFVFDFHDCR